jgi:hypothetical protein
LQKKTLFDFSLYYGKPPKEDSEDPNALDVKKYDQKERKKEI